ncbi:MAG TPA: hypothetical protein VE988_01085, partial [Gemmataceae bacterium]|nr:hypothetical protein [Gemmataceae bacterium]
MEKEIMSAKGIKVTSETSYHFGGQVIKFKGASQLGGENKARMSFEGIDIIGRPEHIQLVSDGKQMQIQTKLDQIPDSEPTPANVGKDLRGALIRGGLAMMCKLVDSENLANFDFEKERPISKFKMGAKEKVGKVDAQVIEYKLMFLETSSASVELWIDIKTHLPLKRQIVDAKGIKIIETYSEFVITPNLDPSIFELPKASEKKKTNKKN